MRAYRDARVIALTPPPPSLFQLRHLGAYAQCAVWDDAAGKFVSADAATAACEPGSGDDDDVVEVVAKFDIAVPFPLSMKARIEAEEEEERLQEEKKRGAGLLERRGAWPTDANLSTPTTLPCPTPPPLHS